MPRFLSCAHVLPRRLFSRRALGVCLTVALTAASVLSTFGQSTVYHYVKIADTQTPRPDDPTGQTFFSFNGNFASVPTVENGTVVFRTGGSDSIWRENADGTGLTKLVDTGVDAPGGGGKFTAFGIGYYGSVPLLDDGTVVFDATSATSDPNVSLHGLYSIPVAGGAVKRIVDDKTVVPDGDGGVFTGFGAQEPSAGEFSVSNGQVAFLGAGGGTYGVYLAGIDGSGLTAIADSNHPFSFTVNGVPGNLGSEFGDSAIANGTVAFFGQQSDASTGYNALFTSTGSFAYHESINSTVVLPGDVFAAPHTRFDLPPLAFDGTTLVFLADDADTAGSGAHFTGLYTLPVNGGALTKIIDSTTTPPGLDATASYGIYDVALDGGLIAFDAADNKGNYGIYVTKADGTGAIIRVAGTGDTLDNGVVVSHIAMVNGGFSQGNIGAQVTNEGLYVLAPGAAVPVVTVAADVAKVTENGGIPGSFLITRTGDTSAKIKVKYKITGNAQPGVDYEKLTGKVKLTAGKASKELLVYPIDRHHNGGEKVKLSLQPGDGYTVGTPAIAKVKIVGKD